MRRSLRLHFSHKPDWEPAIRRSFRFTAHKLHFGPFTANASCPADLLIPLTLEDTEQVARWSVQSGCPHPLAAPPALIGLCNNKEVLNRTLRDLGFGELIPDFSGNLPPPYVLKKKVDQWGRHTRIIQTAAEEGSLGALRDSAEYFRQRIVPGHEEYASHILMRRGRVLCSVTVRLQFDSEVFVYGRDGLRPRERTVARCRHLRVLEKMLAAIGYEGLCCIDYKIWKNQPAVFEINPRFGASLAPYFYSFLRHLWA